MIAPTTLTTQGPEPILGGNNDFWTYSNEGYLVRVHRTKRKALVLPYKTCPVPTDNLENYRRTIVNRPDKNNEDLRTIVNRPDKNNEDFDFEEHFQSISNQRQKRVLKGQAWTGETWFKLKPGTTVPTTTVAPQKTDDKSAKDKQSYTSSSSRQETSKKTTAFTPTHRFTTKAPASTQLVPTSKSTSLPAPSTMDRHEDHWIQEGHMWKRVHIQPRNELYIPQQTQHGPDITKLKPERVTFMNPQDGTRMTRFDDQWTAQERGMTDKTWTGSTNFEEITTYKEEYITDEEDAQQAENRPGNRDRKTQKPGSHREKEHKHPCISKQVRFCISLPNIFPGFKTFFLLNHIDQRPHPAEIFAGSKEDPKHQRSNLSNDRNFLNESLGCLFGKRYEILRGSVLFPGVDEVLHWVVVRPTIRDVRRCHVASLGSLGGSCGKEA